MDGKITRLVPVKKFLLLVVLMVVVNFATAQTAVVTSDANATAARIRWWREARFGMFIHYGPVTLTGKEISW
jgi:alpha-L-fucosidase